MKILFLGPGESPVAKYLEGLGHKMLQTEGALAPLASPFLESPDWIISHGYRLIVPGAVIRSVPQGRAINLHISYLPWNRGADPNLWSWINDTPKGVSIHLLDEGIDTGPLCNRRLVSFDCADHTLASSYAKLQDAMVELFKDTWPKAYKRGRYLPCVQPNEDGSCHMKADKASIEHLLTKGWDTPVAELR